MLLAHGDNGIARLAGFAAMPQNGLEHAACTSIMQQLCVTANGCGQALAPQRCGTPLATIGPEFTAVVGQPFAQVVEQ